MTSRHALGNLIIEVEHEAGPLSYLTEELGLTRIDPIGPPHVLIRFRRHLPRLKDAHIAGDVEIADNACQVTRRNMNYRVERAGPTYILSVTIAPPRLRVRLAPSWVYRSRNFDGLSYYDDAVKNLIYVCLDYLFQAAQIPLGQSFLHASTSCLTDDPTTGIALAGWGGVGKTTTLMKLISSGRWLYLSDDLGIVDSGGTIHHNPKKMFIYPYNLESDQQLQHRAMSQMDAIERLLWRTRFRLNGPRGARRRMSFQQLFPQTQIALKSDLRKAVLVERVRSTKSEVCTLTPKVFARACAATLLYELAPFSQLSYAIHSTCRVPALPTVATMLNETEAILASACNSADLYGVRVPATMSALDMQRLVESVVADQ